MLSPEEFKLKIEALDAEAAKLSDPDGVRYRDLAMRWRLLV